MAVEISRRQLMGFSTDEVPHEQLTLGKRCGNKAGRWVCLIKDEIVVGLADTDP